MTNQLRVIWAAIMMSTVVYFAVLWVSMRDRPITRVFVEAVRDPRTLAAYGAAVVVYFAAFLLSGSLDHRPGRSDAQVRRAAIVRYAMLEMICVIGLVIAFVEADWRLYLPPFVLATFGFLRSLPRERYRF